MNKDIKKVKFEMMNSSKSFEKKKRQITFKFKGGGFKLLFNKKESFGKESSPKKEKFFIMKIFVFFIGLVYYLSKLYELLTDNL